FENCIIKKENEYAKLWNDWYKKCKECKFNKIPYDKSYKDMQQKIKRLQVQLRDLKGKPPMVGETYALSKPVTSNSIPTPQGSKVVQNDTVIAPGMFRIKHFKPSREEKHVPNKVRASARTNPITVSQPPVITKKVKQKANVSINEHQKKQKPKVKKTKKVGSIERLASPKPSNPRSFLRWSPTGRLFDLKGKIIESSKSDSQSDCSKGDNACTSNPHESTIKWFPNFTFSLAGTVYFGNDHVAAILGFSDLQWGNILIARVYFIKGLGHNLFSVGQFCDSDLEVIFRRNACFVRNLEGVDLLKGNRLTNLYTINLHEMAFASPICLMARASSTKSWLWHQRLSHLNFDTINDLAKNDLVLGERKPRKGQNQIKTRQKREAWRNPEVSKAVTVNKARKTKESKSLRDKSAKSFKVILIEDKEKGCFCI
nr:integrase, catalytic region, zinc finger, CCHC-type, peptidase aspartic, catalytic [Tanacetum cinerariifolium]